jgi:hypothetical protein
VFSQCGSPDSAAEIQQALHRVASGQAALDPPSSGP